MKSTIILGILIFLLGLFIGIKLNSSINKEKTFIFTDEIYQKVYKVTLNGNAIDAKNKLYSKLPEDSFLILEDIK